MKRILIFLSLLTGVVIQGSDQPAKPLADSDRLLIREAQLALSQAHVARLQIEIQVREAEDRIKQLVQNLKTQYACSDCELNADFTWTRKPQGQPEAASKAKTPAPTTAGGQTSNKE